MRTLQLNETKSIAGATYSYVPVDYSKLLAETAQDVAHEATVDAAVFGAVAGGILLSLAAPLSVVVGGAAVTGAIVYNYSYQNNDLWLWNN